MECDVFSIQVIWMPVRALQFDSVAPSKRTWWSCPRNWVRWSPPRNSIWYVSVALNWEALSYSETSHSERGQGEQKFSSISHSIQNYLWKRTTSLWRQNAGSRTGPLFRGCTVVNFQLLHYAQDGGTPLLLLHPPSWPSWWRMVLFPPKHNYMQWYVYLLCGQISGTSE